MKNTDWSKVVEAWNDNPDDDRMRLDHVGEDDRRVKALRQSFHLPDTRAFAGRSPVNGRDVIIFVDPDGGGYGGDAYFKEGEPADLDGYDFDPGAFDPAADRIMVEFGATL